MIEQQRGCGFRKIGGIYLEGDYHAVPCDRLPYYIEKCPVCDQGISFTRAFTWINWYKYAGVHEPCPGISDPCTCEPNCPICYPDEFEPEENLSIKHGLMFVGESFYTPESFIEEAQRLGISKRLGSIPRELKVGRTWVLLANKKHGPEKKPAVFFAFRPSRVVQIVSPKDLSKKGLVESLKKRGITPLIGLADKNGDVRETYTIDEWNELPLSKRLFKKV